MKASSGHRFSFSASGNVRNGKSLGGNVEVEGSYLPPSDHGIRVALILGGEKVSAEVRSLHVTAASLNGCAS